MFANLLLYRRYWYWGFLLAGKLQLLQTTGQAQTYLRNGPRRDYSKISTKCLSLLRCLFQKKVCDARYGIIPSSNEGILHSCILERRGLPNTRFPCYLLFLFKTAAYYIYAATWLAKIPISDTKEMKAVSLGIYSWKLHLHSQKTNCSVSCLHLLL